jgi:hypothetical protein
MTRKELLLAVGPVVAVLLILPSLQGQRRASLTLPVVDALPPVGTILPFMGPKDRIPPGWTLCDGKLIDAKHGFKKDEVDPFWWGKNVPDLRGCFLRGRVAAERLGNKAGRDDIPAHQTKKDGQHKHSFQDPERGIVGHTGSIAYRTEVAAWTERNKEYSVTNPFGAYGDDNSFILTRGGAPDQRRRGHGQHVHLFGKGKDGRYYARAVSANSIMTKEKEGEHSHEIDSIPFIPSYVASDFIIRIR